MVASITSLISRNLTCFVGSCHHTDHTSVGELDYGYSANETYGPAQSNKSIMLITVLSNTVQSHLQDIHFPGSFSITDKH